MTEAAHRIEQEFEQFVKYAEVLYKCALCTTLPTILTCKKTFVSHVKDIHLMDQLSMVPCQWCELRFGTEEDLNMHVGICHQKEAACEASDQRAVVSPGHDRGRPLVASFQVEHGGCNTEKRPASEEGNSQAPADPVVSRGDGKQPKDTEGKDLMIKTEPEDELAVEPGAAQVTLSMQPARDWQDYTRDELHAIFGKYASTVHIRGETFLYCQVCMFRTGAEDEFQAHFNSDEHRRIVENLELTHAKTQGSLTGSRGGAGGRGRVNPRYQGRRPWLENDGDPGTTPVGKFPRLSAPCTNAHVSSSPYFQESGYVGLPNSASINQKTNEKSHKIQGQYVNPPLPQQMPSVNDIVSLDSLQQLVNTVCSQAGSPVLPAMSSLGQQPTVQQAPPPPVDAPGKAASATVRYCKDCGFACTSDEELHGHQKEFHDTEAPTKGDENVMSLTETEKVSIIKDHLPNLIQPYRQSYVLRGTLLDKLGERIKGVDLAWGPACNRAVRELFPHSQVTRRGATKSTYFCELRLVGQAGSEGVPAQPEVDEEAATNPSILRDIAKDTELLIQTLPEVIEFTGNMSTSLRRELVLQALSEKLRNTSVLHWGVECNRALRQAFPQVYIKRRGTNKTTFYHGIAFLRLTSDDDDGHFETNSEESPNSAEDEDEEDAEEEDEHTDTAAEANNTQVSSKGHGGNVDGIEHASVAGVPVQPLPCAAETQMLKNSCVSLMRDSEESAGACKSPCDMRTIEKLILLYPGPFVVGKFLCRRHQRMVPNMEHAAAAMTALQQRGLGQLYTMEDLPGTVFYKYVPSEQLEEPLSLLNIRSMDYQVMFAERDPKLQADIHDAVRAYHPQLRILMAFYKH